MFGTFPDVQDVHVWYTEEISSLSDQPENIEGALQLSVLSSWRRPVWQWSEGADNPGANESKRNY